MLLLPGSKLGMGAKTYFEIKK